MYEINLFFYEFLINDNFVAMRENLLLSKREFENVNFVEWDIFREFVTTDNETETPQRKYFAALKDSAVSNLVCIEL